jgi:hypothetical protein
MGIPERKAQEDTVAGGYGDVVRPLTAETAQGILDLIAIGRLSHCSDQGDVWVELEKFFEVCIIFSKLLGTHGHRSNLYLQDWFVPLPEGAGYDLSFGRIRVSTV